MRHWKSWLGNSVLCLLLLAGLAEAQNTGTVNTCKATAAAPTYGEGSRQPLSCDLSGSLRSSASGGGGAVTVADGADVAQGTTTDAAKTDSTLSGTVIAWLKGLVKILSDVWDSVNHRLKVDGSGVTQPVSGTVTANAGTNLNTSALLTTTAHDAAFGIAGTADTQVRTVQGIAGMTKLLVTPDSVALPANQSVNVAQINGVATTMGNGVSGTGVQRITIASDSTYQPTIAALPNEGQQTMANSISVALASDQTVPDPCTFRAKSYAPINSSTAATTQLVAASASNKLYICAVHMLTNAANNVALVEDDTIACASPTAGIIGGTTAATGYIFAANGGLTLGSGNGTVGITAATNRYVCIITSAATQLSGGLTYVLAP